MKNKGKILETAAVAAVLAANVAGAAPNAEMTNAELVDIAKGYAVDCSGQDKYAERRNAVTQEILRDLEAKGGKITQGTYYAVERGSSAVSCLTDRIQSNPNFTGKTVSYRGVGSQSDVSQFQISVTDAGQATIKAPVGSDLHKRAGEAIKTQNQMTGDNAGTDLTAEYDAAAAAAQAEYDANVEAFKAEQKAKVDAYRAHQREKANAYKASQDERKDDYRASQKSRADEYRASQAQKKAQFMKEQEMKRAAFKAHQQGRTQ